MNIQPRIIGTTMLTALLLAGCARRPEDPDAHKPIRITDLPVLEVETKKTEDPAVKVPPPPDDDGNFRPVAATPSESYFPAELPPGFQPRFLAARSADAAAAERRSARTGADMSMEEPVDLEILTQAARTFIGQTGREPRSCNELVARGMLVQLPKPPAGKKFALHWKQFNVILLDDTDKKPSGAAGDWPAYSTNAP
jgi:hypothetical protein